MTTQRPNCQWNDALPSYASAPRRHCGPKPLSTLSALLLLAVASWIHDASAQSISHSREETVAAAPEELARGLLPDEVSPIVRIICQSSGTVGTAFKHRSGHFLAADSPIRACTEVLVSLPSGDKISAKVLARDRQLDLAMLLPKMPIPGRALEVAQPRELSVGTSVASLGYPAGYVGNLALLTVGYVSGIHRMQIDNDRTFTKLILGGNYNSGLSGSPLFDKNGHVVGILSGLLSPLSDRTVSALNALKAERGSTFIWENPDGVKVPLSQGQVVAMVLEEVLGQGHYLVGLATPLQHLKEFMAENGVEL